MLTKDKINAFYKILDEDIISPDEFLKIISAISTKTEESTSKDAHTMKLINDITYGVCEYYKISPDDLVTSKHQKEMSIIYYMCKNNGLSLYEISNYFKADRDEVCRGINWIATMDRGSSEIREDIGMLTRKLFVEPVIPELTKTTTKGASGNPILKSMFFNKVNG